MTIILWNNTASSSCRDNANEKQFHEVIIPLNMIGSVAKKVALS